MSAVLASVPAQPIELDLRSPGRILSIRLRPNDFVWAAVYRPRRGRGSFSERPLATGVARREPGHAEQFAIRLDNLGASLWLGTACFPISDPEAARIEAVYGPHGLQVHRTEATS